MASKNLTNFFDFVPKITEEMLMLFHVLISSRESEGRTGYAPLRLRSMVVEQRAGVRENNAYSRFQRG